MSLQRNSFFTSIGGVARLIVSVFTMPALVRLLGIDGFGIWTVLGSTAAILALGEIGINVAVTNFVAAEHARGEHDAVGKTLLTSLLFTSLLGVLVTVGCWIGTPALCRFLFPHTTHMQMAIDSLHMLTFSLLPRFWQLWGGGVEGALQRYDIQVAIEAPCTLLTQIGSVAAAFLGFGVFGAAAWTVIITVLTATAHFLAVRHLWRGVDLRFGADMATARRLGVFSFQYTLTNAGYVLFAQVDRLIVSSILGAGAAGLYAAATSVTSKISEFCVLPLRVLPAAISAATALGDQARVRTIFLKGARVNGAVVCAMVLPVLFLSHTLARLLVGGANAMDAATLLRTLAFVSGLSMLWQAAAWTALGMGLPGLNARWSLLASFTASALVVLFSMRFGVQGAAFGNAGFTVSAMIAIAVTRRLGLAWSDFFRVFAPSAIGITVSWLIGSSALYRDQSLWLQLPICGILTFVVGRFIAGPELFQQCLDAVQSKALFPVMRRLGLAKLEPAA